jgi:drug/metabolite transporter (DMT)-like permease
LKEAGIRASRRNSPPLKGAKDFLFFAPFFIFFTTFAQSDGINRMNISIHYGELAALATAVFWTVTSMSFEVAAKRVGSLAVNLIRLSLAFVFLAIFTYIYRGIALPVDASSHAWIWLSLSGIVGFVFGDYFLFRSYEVISSRIAMLVMTLVPPITALIGWLILGEKMTALHVFGMFLTVGGIGLAIFSRPDNGNKLRLSYPLRGILFALGGAIGQAVGLVMSKYGMQSYDAFASSQIRIIAGGLGFGLIVLFLGKGALIRNAVHDKRGMKATILGSFFGPFLGVSFSLIAVKYTETGIASTIMAIVPILIIPPAILIFKEKFTWLELAGAVISVGGVVLMFM